MFSPEAFAYSMDQSWELNASVRIKGYLQKEEESIFFCKISYWVDLVRVEGDTVKNVDAGVLENKGQEKTIDLQINAQVQLDSTYVPGKYKLIFRAEDNFDQRRTSLETNFELSEE